MLKLGRNYILTISTPSGGTLIIQPPFTLELDITRAIFSASNSCTIRILNLKKDNRDQIRFNVSDQTTFRSVTLQAGYGPTKNLPIIFIGNITHAWSVREGTSFITTIEAYDGGYDMANSFVSTNTGTNQTGKEVFSFLISQFPYVSPGAIGNYVNAYPRGTAIVGTTADILTEWSGRGFFIDSQKAYILQDSEYVDDSVPIQVSAETGLLNTPVRENTILHFDMIFEPRAKPGRLAILTSTTDPLFRGQFKISQVKHSGTISDAVCGDLTTSISTFYLQQPIAVPPVAS